MKHWLIATTLLSTMTFSVYGDEKFKVCADPLNPPYSTQAQDGFENKIAHLLATELNQELEYTWFPQRIGFIRNTLTAPVNENEVDSKNFKCDVIIGLPAQSDMVLTTTPYYRSTYVLLIAKNRGWDDIQNPKQLADLPQTRREKLKIAMFDRTPSVEWMQKNDLLDYGTPYQSMTGDKDNNVTMQLEQDLNAKKIDMVILWGPIAGYIISHNPEGYNSFSMQSSAGIKFDYAMSMGVRKNDKDRKEQLDKLIAEKNTDIQAILNNYHIPLLPLH